ncbi:hypothetical protein B0H19DRAFT_1373162 [Mycena capillaripes]|nr:hypothetical protein B0H19DRAFT_1373162 [Mycena capillaripes]
MPSQATVTKIRVTNVIADLMLASALLGELNNVLVTSALHAISNTTASLITLLQARNVTGQSLGPPLLASICRAWRHIAVNLQSLWSNITTYQMVTEYMLESCLARAGRRPLALDMDLTGGNAERNFAAAAQYSDSVVCDSSWSPQPHWTWLGPFLIWTQRVYLCGHFLTARTTWACARCVRGPRHRQLLNALAPLCARTIGIDTP